MVAPAYTIVGTVSFTQPGTYTCYIRGVRNYTGLMECIYTVQAPPAEIASGWSGATEWTLTSDGVLTVYGSGNMKNYGYGGGQPWLNKGVDITSVIIEESVASVGSGAFMNLTTLESVTFPESMTKMGEAAFYGSGLTELREAVFCGTAITTITFPEGITKVGPYVFRLCTNLETIELPESIAKLPFPLLCRKRSVCIHKWYLHDPLWLDIWPW